MKKTFETELEQLVLADRYDAQATVYATNPQADSHTREEGEKILVSTRSVGRQADCGLKKNRAFGREQLQCKCVWGLFKHINRKMD